MPASLITLVIIVIRNPIIQSRRLFESVLKLNVVFLSFIRRIQKSDLLLQWLFYEDDHLELDKVYSLISDFDGVVDQTMDEFRDIDQI